MIAVVAAVAVALAPTATVDKTFSCRHGGDLDVRASPKGDRAFTTASAESSGYLGISTGVLTNASGLVFVRARPELGLNQGRRWPSGAYARARECYQSRKQVPLTSRGLPGPALRWGKEYTCFPSGRVLIRVRAILAAPAAWRRLDEELWGARANVVSAQLAVRTERTNQPVSFSTLDSAGRTKLWVRADCAS